MKRFTPPRNKSGFTLAELLIVVAIIAVLVAIAIPVFSSQLDKSRLAVDEANERSAESMAMADYLMNDESGDVTYTFGKDSNKNLGIKSITGYTYNSTTDSVNRTPMSSESEATGEHSSHKDGTLTVVIKSGKLNSTKWETTKTNE